MTNRRLFYMIASGFVCSDKKIGKKCRIICLIPKLHNMPSMQSAVSNSGLHGRWDNCNIRCDFGL